MHRRTFLGALAAGTTLSVVASAATATNRAAAPELSPSLVVDTPDLQEVAAGPDGRYTYGAVGDGLLVADCDSPESTRILGRTTGTIDGTDLSRAVDVVVSGDRALVAGPYSLPREAEPSGGALFDVSDPANPEQVAEISTDFAVHNAGLAGDTAYLTGYGLDDQAFVIYDVTDDDPVETARWSVIDENDAWGDVNRTFFQCHDVTAIGDRAYLSYWDAGTWILDASDPANPEPVAQVGGVPPGDVPKNVSRDELLSVAGSLPGNAHNAAVSGDGALLAVGREAFADLDKPGYQGPSGVGVFDISDPTSPERVTALRPPVVTGSEGERHVATVHNFAFSGRRLYAAWYAGGVRAYDLTDPANPETLGAWAAPLEASFWGTAALDEGFVAASYADPSAENADGENAKLYAFPEPTTENAVDAATWTVTDGGLPENQSVYGFRNTTSTSRTTTSAETTTAGTDTTTPPASTEGTVNSRTTSAPTTDESANGSAPGFGVGAAVAGAALAALHRLSRD